MAKEESETKKLGESDKVIQCEGGCSLGLGDKAMRSSALACAATAGIWPGLAL